MGRLRVRQPILVCACMAILLGIMPEQAFTGQKKSNEKAMTPISEKDLKSSSEQVQRKATLKVTKTVQPSLAARKPVVLPKPATSPTVELVPARRKGHGPINAHRKIAPKAIVQPRKDLMYYGVLEDSQRYDPHPNSHTAGVPNPQLSDLTHDHFQELDRNQDGKIDPVERAFGRIDMDRDLHNRQLQ
jgi:hypothetical protein